MEILESSLNNQWKITVVLLSLTPLVKIMNTLLLLVIIIQKNKKHVKQIYLVQKILETWKIKALFIFTKKLN